MRIFSILFLSLFYLMPVYGLTVQEHAADSSNPHGARMKITEKLNLGTTGDYDPTHTLKVIGGAIFDSLDTSGGNIIFGTASSLNGSLSIGTTTAGSSRVRVIGTITATTFVGDGTLLTGIGAGTGTGNWTDTGSSTQTLYPDTITRKVGIGTTTVSGQFAVSGNSNFTGTVTATTFVGDGSQLTGISAGDGTETIWVDTGEGLHPGTITRKISMGTSTIGSRQFTIVGSSTFLEQIAIGSNSTVLGGLTDKYPDITLGDSDTGFKWLGDGIYGLVANGDLQMVINGNSDHIAIGTDTVSSTVKFYVKDDIQASGTITATNFAGNGAGITGINDNKWTDTSEGLQPGTITYKIRIGTTTINGADLQVEGTASVSGTLTAGIVIANAPDGETAEAIANAGQLAKIKAELLTEWVDHAVSTSDIHGVGSSTIASVAYVDTAIGTHSALTDAHYATSTATAERIIMRDSNGRAQVAMGTANADIATVGQVGDYRWVRVGLTSAAADTPVYFVTDADVGSKSVYLITFVGRVNGGNGWLGGTMTKVEILDTSGLNLFLGITLADLTANTTYFPGMTNNTPGQSYYLRTGTPAGKGLKLVADGTAIAGSTLYITALIKIE